MFAEKLRRSFPLRERCSGGEPSTQVRSKIKLSTKLVYFWWYRRGVCQRLRTSAAAAECFFCRCAKRFAAAQNNVSLHAVAAARSSTSTFSRVLRVQPTAQANLTRL